MDADGTTLRLAPRRPYGRSHGFAGLGRSRFATAERPALNIRLRPRTERNTNLKRMRLALHWQVLIGLAVGVIYAWMSITFGWNDFTVDYIKPFGDIFINVLKLIAVPLVCFSIMSGVASLGDPAKLGRLGVKTVVTYLLTTMTAVIVGLLLVNLMQPDARVSDDLLESNRIRYELWRDANGIQVLDDINLRNDPALADKVAQITRSKSP